MDSFLINGGKRLYGELDMKAAKNSVLPLISCCILCKEDIVFKNCPHLTDIEKMLEIIRSLGGTADYAHDEIHINCKDLQPKSIQSDLTGSIRSSVFILGPILSRFSEAQIAYPGGCEIGSRPIDIHIEGLRTLNAVIEEREGVIYCDGKNLRNAEIKLRFPSVGATENLMMAAVLTKGRSRIVNAAREPEILDLQNFINAMGGNVSGAGSNVITIDGVESLHTAVFTPISDRIVAGTYLCLAAMCGGKVTLKNVDHPSICQTYSRLAGCGCNIELNANEIKLISSGSLKSAGFIKTEPYPGFPTDMQAQFVAMLSLADGETVVEENLFENRFKYTQQLVSMGANISVLGHRAMIKGVKALKSGKVCAQDLRGGAALVMAAAATRGCSQVLSAEHIDRGYFRIEDELGAIGVDIKRLHNT